MPRGFLRSREGWALFRRVAYVSDHAAQPADARSQTGIFFWLGPFRALPFPPTTTLRNDDRQYECVLLTYEPDWAE